VIKKHIDIHFKYYKQTQLVASDDFLAHREQAEADEIRVYLDQRGIAWRDDSILVDWYVDNNSDTYCVVRQELFEDSWQTRPVVMELEHYHAVVENGNWKGPDGRIFGADIVRGACKLMYPTWIGFHGDAARWLADNPNLARELANWVGYWYFPQTVTLPDSVVSGKKNSFQLTVLNRGLAPAYQRYRVQVKLEGAADSWIQYLSEIDNRRWLPDSLVTENCSLAPASDLPEGEYLVKIRMRKENGVAVRPVWFALDGSLLDENGFYQVGTVYVKK